MSGGLPGPGTVEGVGCGSSLRQINALLERRSWLLPRPYLLKKGLCADLLLRPFLRAGVPGSQ